MAYIPYRQWNRFHMGTLESFYSGTYTDNWLKWTLSHYGYMKVGDGRAGGGGWDRRHYRTILKGHGDDKYDLLPGMDQAMKAFAWMSVGVEINDSAPDINQVQVIHSILKDLASPKTWDPDKVSGRLYDGHNQWEDPTPPPLVEVADGFTNIDPTNGDLPGGYWWAFKAFKAGVNTYVNLYQDELFRQGLCFYCGNYDNPPDAVGEYFYMNLTPSVLNIHFFNPVVNSLSSYAVNPDGGEELIIYGFGFYNSDADIGGNTPAGGWEDIVDEIQFIGLQGQGTTTLIRSPDNDFTVDDPGTITISNMPILEIGTYDIKLIKIDVKANVGDVEAYAGDWRCDSRGRVSEGLRIELCVGECRGGKGLLTKWGFTNKLGVDASQWYAQIDTRRPSTFYEGRIQSVSELTRAVDDKTGMPSISDMTIELANHDKVISSLMTTHFIKNQVVELIYIDENGNETNILNMIVDDHDDQGTSWVFYLKDFSQKYFRVKIPKYIITKDFYASAHENAIGQPMPEVLGLNYLVGEEEKGAVKAHCVNTGTWEYLAARGSLHSITQVYSDNAAPGVAHNVVYKDGGRTYIIFDAPGVDLDKDVTFNCTGYMFGPWNSANGYVQNPARILQFLLAFIAETPVQCLDMDSFDILKDLFDDWGEGTSGRYILQAHKDVESEMKGLLWTYGAKIFPSKLGKFEVARKDKCDFQTDRLFHDQIDAISKAIRKSNLRSAVNYVKAEWDYYPNAGVHLDAEVFKRQCSIDDFGSTIEAQDSPWSFPWTTSADWVTVRAVEELLKLGYGDRKIEITIPIEWINDIDALDDELDIFSNFAYQDMFGPHESGAGEVLHYYYVESISINTQAQTLSITGVDLQWLMRQCIILGDESVLAPTWMTASEYERIFGYLGSEVTETFADGEPTKLLCKERL